MRDARIYLDNAAATVLHDRVHQAMEPFWRERYGNAGALHAEGMDAKRALEDARTTTARVLGAEPDEIIFTSGGTEANNLAIAGLLRALMRSGKRPEELHIITSAIEHSSVLDCYRRFALEGVRTTFIEVDKEGRVDENALRTSIVDDTVLISIMYANNEFGTIERIADIAKIAREARKRRGGIFPYVHTDASQAAAWLPCKVRTLGVDLLTVDAQKMHGPKGCGCLVRRRGITLEPLMYGGGQEGRMRPGTPPLPLIAGLAQALLLVEEEREAYAASVLALRDRFIERVRAGVPDAILNGAVGYERIANNVNFSFPGQDGEQLVLELDARGVAASTRSACLRDRDPGSYMVAALHKGGDTPRSSVRFSLSRFTTGDEVERAADILIDVVQWLRGNEQ